jgi:hypothetical protein
MANAFYPKGKELALSLLCGVGTRPTGTLKVCLVDTAAYIYSGAHQFFSSVTGVVGSPVALPTPTFTNGTLAGANTSIPAVTGPTAEAMIFYLDTGAPGTSPLILYLDTGQNGLPITPNGGNVQLSWNNAGIAAL